MKNVITAFRVKEHVQNGKKSYTHYCVVKDQISGEIVFQSGYTPYRVDCAKELNVFLNHHPEIINKILA